MRSPVPAWRSGLLTGIAVAVIGSSAMLDASSSAAPDTPVPRSDDAVVTSAAKKKKKKKRVLRGPRGFRGKAGAPGPAGPVGPPGPVGPIGVSGLETVVATTPENTDEDRSGVAPCPPGKRVVSGSADVNVAGSSAQPKVYLTESTPTSQNGQEGWSAAATESLDQDDAVAWSIKITATCVNAS